MSHAELAWNPEDGWVLSLEPDGGGLVWFPIDAPADEPVARLAGRLAGVAALTGATCSITVARCYRRVGTIELVAGSVVATEERRR